MRKIKKGDVLIRFLMPFSVWHYGLVIRVDSQNANDILLLEFDDSNKISRVTLHQFMYHRVYFWIDDFDKEMLDHPDQFYSIDERIKRGIKLADSTKLFYTINNYNCEYFVRRCVFKDKLLWLSGQTREIGKTKFGVFSKLAFLFGYGIVGKHADFSRCECDFNPTAFGYIVCLHCGKFFNKDKKYDILKCTCNNITKLR